MELSVINFNVNSGCQIIRKSKKVDLQTFCRISELKKHKEYDEIVMSEDYAELVWYVARCPYCGKESLLSGKAKSEKIYLCKKCEQFSLRSEEKAGITVTHEENSINFKHVLYKRKK